MSSSNYSDMLLVHIDALLFLRHILLHVYLCIPTQKSDTPMYVRHVNDPLSRC